MGTALALPLRPDEVARTEDLPLGVFAFVSLVGGKFTVRRDVRGWEHWYPVAEAHGLPFYPTFDHEGVWAQFYDTEAQAFTAADWPLWGRTHRRG